MRVLFYSIHSYDIIYLTWRIFKNNCSKTYCRDSFCDKFSFYRIPYRYNPQRGCSFREGIYSLNIFFGRLFNFPNSHFFCSILHICIYFYLIRIGKYFLKNPIRDLNFAPISIYYHTYRKNSKYL